MAEYAAERARFRMRVIRYDIDGWKMDVTMRSRLGEPDFTVTYEMDETGDVTGTYLNPKECRDDYIHFFLIGQVLDAKKHGV